MIENQFQFENTRAKRAELRELLDRKRNEHDATYAHELTIRSLMRRINRLTEEMARYTSQQHSNPTRS